MAKTPTIPRSEDFDEALGALVHARSQRASTAAEIAALESRLAAFRRDLAELDKDIAARAAALKAAHAKGDFFEWAGKSAAS
jgi:BMFP domain-containing protein YqiC